MPQDIYRLDRVQTADQRMIESVACTVSFFSALTMVSDEKGRALDTAVYGGDIGGATIPTSCRRSVEFHGRSD